MPNVCASGEPTLTRVRVFVKLQRIRNFLPPFCTTLNMNQRRGLRANHPSFFFGEDDHHSENGTGDKNSGAPDLSAATATAFKQPKSFADIEARHFGLKRSPTVSKNLSGYFQTMTPIEDGSSSGFSPGINVNGCSDPTSGPKAAAAQQPATSSSSQFQQLRTTKPKHIFASHSDDEEHCSQASSDDDAAGQDDDDSSSECSMRSAGHYVLPDGLRSIRYVNFENSRSASSSSSSSSSHASLSAPALASLRAERPRLEKSRGSWLSGSSSNDPASPWTDTMAAQIALWRSSVETPSVPSSEHP